MERRGNENDNETLCYMYSVQKFCLHNYAAEQTQQFHFITWIDDVNLLFEKDSDWKSGLVKPFSLIKNERGFKFNVMNYFIFSLVTCKYYMYT